MNEIKPITNYFGEYPHSKEAIIAMPDPLQRGRMLRDNLSWQLQARTKDLVTLSGVMNIRTTKRIRKMIQKGWMVQSTFQEPLIRRIRYDLVRPQVTREEAQFMGWEK